MNWKDFLESKELLWIIIILNLINAIYSAFILLVFLHVPVHYWIFLNICAPIQFFTITALLIRNKLLSDIAIPLLIFFGFGAIFIFSWSGHMMQAQLNHILMTITAIYILLMNLKDKRNPIMGISIGIIIILLLEVLIFPKVMNMREVKGIIEQMI